MIIQAGDFWIADILFTNGSTSKRRPILVLWSDDRDVIVAAVTSSVPRTLTDVPLDDWRASGLRVASTVRLSRLDCLEQSLLLFRLGHVSQADAQRLKDGWGVHIRPQF